MEKALADESALRLGMVVRVDGTLNADETSGQAESVVYDVTLRGPIAAAVSVQGSAVEFAVFGLTVQADSTATVFASADGSTLRPQDLAPGHLVEVSGFVDLVGGVVSATRIERESLEPDAGAEVDLQGIVAELDVEAGSFLLQGARVLFDANTEFKPSMSVLVNGAAARVEGRLLTNGDVQASEIEQGGEAPVAPDDGADGDDDSMPDSDTDGGNDGTTVATTVSIEGPITDLTSQSMFVVDGQVIDAGGAAVEPADAVLAVGARVEVKGTAQGTTLLASKIEVQSAPSTTAIAAGEIVAINPGDRTLELQIYPGAGALTVAVASDTVLSLDGTDRPRFEQLQIGQVVTVRGTFSDRLQARFIVDEAEEDKRIIVGPVQDVDAAAGTLRVLGVTFSVAADTEFDLPFATPPLASLDVGQTVRVEDEMPFDGTLSKVKLP